MGETHLLAAEAELYRAIPYAKLVGDRTAPEEVVMLSAADIIT